MQYRSPGVALIAAPAILEHPRTRTYGRLSFTTFDAIIRSSDAINDDVSVACSLRYMSLSSETPFPSGTYDIRAKVSKFHLTPSFASVHEIYYESIQVAAFRPNILERSPARNDTEFLLMGELIRVRVRQLWLL